MRKIVESAATRNRFVAREKWTAPEVNEITHDLFNQLTVINLCGDHIAASLRAASDPAVAADWATLARAAEKATELAERLAQLMAESPAKATRRVERSPNLQSQADKVRQFF